MVSSLSKVPVILDAFLASPLCLKCSSHFTVLDVTLLKYCKKNTHYQAPHYAVLSDSPDTSSHLHPNISHSTMFLKHAQFMFFPQNMRQASCPHETRSILIVF
jgi:hypothetical protein